MPWQLWFSLWSRESYPWKANYKGHSFKKIYKKKTYLPMVPEPTWRQAKSPTVKKSVAESSLKKDSFTDSFFFNQQVFWEQGYSRQPPWWSPRFSPPGNNTYIPLSWAWAGLLIHFKGIHYSISNELLLLKLYDKKTVTSVLDAYSLLLSQSLVTHSEGNQQLMEMKCSMAHVISNWGKPPASKNSGPQSNNLVSELGSESSCSQAFRSEHSPGSTT